MNQDMGTMYFDKGEYQIINLGLGDSKSSEMKVRKITLTRI